MDDPCDVAPCSNGGTCSRTGLTDFSCVCQGNWGGETCDGEIEIRYVLGYAIPGIVPIPKHFTEKDFVYNG